MFQVRPANIGHPGLCGYCDEQFACFTFEQFYSTLFPSGPDRQCPVLLWAGSGAPPGRSGLAQIQLCSKKRGWELGSGGVGCRY